MNLWQDIVSNALLGTERKAFAIEPTNGALDELLSKIEVAEMEAALLTYAAVVALHQQAGRLPVDAQPTSLAACEADETPACSERAAQHLALMLSGEHREALREWLDTLASSGKRVRELLLPSLLNYGIANKPLREAILYVIGKRGVWLASHNPAWSYATSANLAEEIWQTGNTEDRVSALKEIRKKDAAQARELLAQSWQQESPQDRARFIVALQNNLSINDESFLENALDDKRKEVRRLAADLLARLPKSRLCKRMLERAAPLLEYKSGLRARLEVKLPEECDKAMTRDGLDATSSYSQANDKLGQKSFVLSQILGAIPIHFWRQKWKVSTADILKLTDKNEWQQALVLGWFNAAQRSQDREMAEALLKEFLIKKQQLFSPLPLVDLLTAKRREEIIIEIIQSHGNEEDARGTIMNLLGAVNHQWSARFTRTILDCAHSYFKTDERAWFYALRTWAFYMSPSIALEEMAKWKLALGDYERKYMVEQIEAPLRFRCELFEELAR